MNHQLEGRAETLHQLDGLELVPVNEGLQASFAAILKLLEDLGAFTADYRPEVAMRLAENQTTAAMLQDDSLQAEDFITFGLDKRDSLVLYSALHRLRLLQVDPPGGVVACREGRTVEFEVNVAGGRGTLQYRWHKHAMSPAGKLERQLLDCNSNILCLSAVDINDCGYYSFCVTDAHGAKVQSGPTSQWELQVQLVRDYDELDDLERWYKSLTSLTLRPQFQLVGKNHKVLFDEIGLEVLLPMFYSQSKGYILLKVTADGPEKNSATVIPCRNIDILMDIIELRTMVSRPEHVGRLLEQRSASPALLSKYIISVLGVQPPTPATADDLVDFIFQHLRQNHSAHPQARAPMVPVDLVQGKEEIPPAHLGARFLVGQNGVFAHVYGAPTLFQVKPRPAPALPVSDRVQFAGGEVFGPSLRQQMPTMAIVTTTSETGKLPLPSSSHKLAIQGVGLSTGISLGVELVRSGYLYQQGKITGRDAAMQIGQTTAISAGVAGGATYVSMGLQQLALRKAGDVVGQAARAILRHPNFAVGAVLLSISTCLDLYRWQKGQLSGQQLRENIFANVASTVASTMAVGAAAGAMGLALATSWTGIGLLVLLGLGISMGVDRAARSTARALEKKALLKRMEANAFELLGVVPSSIPLSAAKREEVSSRYRTISTYLHPDAVNMRSADNVTLFQLMKECRDFLLNPSTDYDLLVNFQGLGDRA